VVSFGVRQVPHNLVAQELAELGGVGVRCGCFCAHMLVKKLLRIRPPRARAADLGLLLAPRLTAPLLPGLVRLSLGLQSESVDVDGCLRTLQRIVQTSRPWPMRFLASSHNGTPRLPQTAIGTRVQDFAMAAAERVFVSKRAARVFTVTRCYGKEESRS
jgi:hypothetical protein